MNVIGTGILPTTYVLNVCVRTRFRPTRQFGLLRVENVHRLLQVSSTYMGGQYTARTLDSE